MADLSQLSDDELVQLFTQESKAALGGQQAPVQNSGFVTSGINRSGISMENLDALRATERVKNETELEKAKQLESLKGPAGDIAGRIALARESLTNIQKIKQQMFPDGTPASFDRGLAFASNLKSTPVIGGLLPAVRPDNPIDPNDDQAAARAQNVFRQMGSSISGRQLIQTGVAARPEETQRLVEQFAPGGTSSGEAAFDALDQLEAFYKDYLRVNDPSGAKGLSEGIEGAQTSPSGLKYKIIK